MAGTVPKPRERNILSCLPKAFHNEEPRCAALRFSLVKEPAAPVVFVHFFIQKGVKPPIDGLPGNQTDFLSFKKKDGEGRDLPRPAF
jgi:hypothetical protein